MTVYSLEQLLVHRRDDEVREICARWTGNGAPAGGREATVALLRDLIAEDDRVDERVRSLPKRLIALFESYLHQPGYVRPLKSVLGDRHLGFQNQYEVEAAVGALAREGLLLPTVGRNWMAYGQPSHAIPVEVAVALETSRRKRDRGLLDTLTLKGFLDRKHFRAAAQRGHHNGEGEPAKAASKSGNGHDKAAERAAQHARQTYKLLLDPAAILHRIERLPEATRKIAATALTNSGGLMPRDLYEKLEGEEGRFDPAQLRQDLEEAMVGTVADLDLSRFGIRSAHEVVTVFNEVTLCYLRDHAAARSPENLEERTAGVDLVSNASRFLRFLDEERVKCTVQGTLFKSTESRILDKLIQATPHEVEPEETLRFLFEFASARHLIDRTAEREFKMSQAGHEFEHKDLHGKLRELLGYAVEEADLPGEHYHQVRLRRIFLRLLRRVDAGKWYDAMFIPFLARNSYLAQLDSLAVEEFFEARFHTGQTAPAEDLQQMCWNLFTWVKRRLHLLGIVDLGYHSGRAVAVRLSTLGAELLGLLPAAHSEGARSTLVVNPDFEVIVFPEADVFPLVHALDRFALRTKSDRLYHFQITEASVRSGLADGLTVSEVIDLLTRKSRTALPQNVLFSLRDWGDRAGVLTMEKALLISARRSELIDRFVELAQVKGHVLRRLSPTCVALRATFPLKKHATVLRELGFFLEKDKDGE